MEEGVVRPSLEDGVGGVVVQHGGVEGRQLECQSAVPVGLGLTALQATSSPMSVLLLATDPDLQAQANMAVTQAR